jgi:hypothetical protein
MNLPFLIRLAWDDNEALLKYMLMAQENVDRMARLVRSLAEARDSQNLPIFARALRRTALLQTLGWRIFYVF